MNKLEKFIKSLQDVGLTEEQIDEAVFALDEYNKNRNKEEYAQQGSQETS